MASGQRAQWKGFLNFSEARCGVALYTAARMSMRINFGHRRSSDPDLIPLVQQLIKSKTAHWSPDMASDPIQASLLNLIAEKKKLLKSKTAAKDKPASAPPSNVVNIMDALKKSLASELKGKKAS